MERFLSYKTSCPTCRRRNTKVEIVPSLRGTCPICCEEYSPSGRRAVVLGCFPSHMVCTHCILELNRRSESSVPETPIPPEGLYTPPMISNNQPPRLEADTTNHEHLTEYVPFGSTEHATTVPEVIYEKHGGGTVTCKPYWATRIRGTVVSPALFHHNSRGVDIPILETDITPEAPEGFIPVYMEWYQASPPYVFHYACWTLQPTDYYV